MQERWRSRRLQSMSTSGIRKIFELGKSLRDPIDLSIGQPHFDVPPSIKRAAQTAIDTGCNGYTVTQGIPELRNRLGELIGMRLPGQNRQVLVTSGTSGALMLALCSTIDPGDEVILFSPYFVSYPNLVHLAGGVPVVIDTYPNFDIDIDQVERAITPRTKAILFSNPANPTGMVLPERTLRDLATCAHSHDILLISDEIYNAFTWNGPARSAAEFNDNVLVVEGFGKTYGMTGWRLGFAHGPHDLLDDMARLQQFTYVCAPSIAQHAALAALDCDIAAYAADYRRKRDWLYGALAQRYDIVKPEGAFYCFPKAPHGTGSEFSARAIDHGLLVIPGCAFGPADTHFRISYAVDDRHLERGIEVLLKLAQ